MSTVLSTFAIRASKHHYIVLIEWKEKWRRLEIVFAFNYCWKTQWRPTGDCFTGYGGCRVQCKISSICAFLNESEESRIILAFRWIGFWNVHLWHRFSSQCSECSSPWPSRYPLCTSWATDGLLYTQWTWFCNASAQACCYGLIDLYRCCLDAEGV